MVVLFVSGLTHLSFSSSEAASSSWDRSDLKSSRNAKSVTIVEVFSFPELTWTRTRFWIFFFLEIENQNPNVKGLGALRKSSEAERAAGAQWWLRSGREAGFMEDNPMEEALGSRYDERARGSERRRPCGGLGSGPGGR